jgi:lipopolysaccharide export system protein LptA
VIAHLALLAALAAPTLTQLPAPGGGTVTVSAEKVRYAFPRHRIEYTGNPVRLTRADSVLTCKRLVAQLDDADQVQQATCEGDVRFERGEKVVTCEKATYEEAASRLTCEGKPVIHSGSLSATGSRLVYELDDDEVTMDDVQGTVPGAQADQRLQALQQRRKARPPREGQK